MPPRRCSVKLSVARDWLQMRAGRATKPLLLFHPSPVPRRTPAVKLHLDKLQQSLYHVTRPTLPQPLSPRALPTPHTPFISSSSQPAGNA